MLLFECKNFNALTLNELHDLYALRSAVFVVEQNCVYQDIDGKDPLALHLIGKKKDKIASQLSATFHWPFLTVFSEQECVL